MLKIVPIMLIINFYLLLFTKKNIYTWYLYHFIGVILPLIQVIILTKKRKKSRFYSISVIVLYIISISFICLTFIWIIFYDFLAIIIG